MDLLEASDVADLMHINKATVYAMVRNNQIPHVRLGPTGRIVRFRRESIESWLAEKEVGPLWAPGR